MPQRSFKVEVDSCDYGIWLPRCRRACLSVVSGVRSRVRVMIEDAQLRVRVN